MQRRPPDRVCADGGGLATALVATGFGYLADERAAQGRVAAYVLPRVRDIRRAGSAALDLCWVADGRVDAYFEAGHQRLGLGRRARSSRPRPARGSAATTAGRRRARGSSPPVPRSRPSCGR